MAAKTRGPKRLPSCGPNAWQTGFICERCTYGYRFIYSGIPWPALLRLGSQRWHFSQIPPRRPLRRFPPLTYLSECADRPWRNARRTIYDSQSYISICAPRRILKIPQKRRTGAIVSMPKPSDDTSNKHGRGSPSYQWRRLLSSNRRRRKITLN